MIKRTTAVLAALSLCMVAACSGGGGANASANNSTNAQGNAAK